MTQQSDAVAQRQPFTVQTLPLEITRDLHRYGRFPVDVIDPSPGVWGGAPTPGLVTVVYTCRGQYCVGECAGTHRALYGPENENGSGRFVIYAD